MSDVPIIAATGIGKHYPGVQALDGVDIAVHPGEIVGLAGENGSGKSTLLKILAGRVSPDAGRLAVDGQDASFASPAEALKAGVALVAQEILVQDDLSIAENLLEGRLPRRRVGLIDWRAANARAREILASCGLGHVDPAWPAGRLALHDQQMIAIAKVVHRRPRVVLFDEPTSSLTGEEAERLYGMIRDLADAGSAVVFITHRLHEYFDLADRLVVLRDGQLVAQERTADVDEATLVERMVGRRLVDLFERPQEKDADGPRAAPVLEVEGLASRRLRGIDLRVGAGEIVAVAGQAGSGRTSLAETLFGQWSHTGVVRIDGEPVALRSTAAAIRSGVALVPENRKRQGIVGPMSVAENLVMPSWARTGRGQVRAPKADRALAADISTRFGVRAANLDVAVESLSGGNQQKVVLGKWAACDIRVLVLDEPTRGVDVGAKAEIYRLIEELAAGGLAVLVLSSELLEVLRLADRVVVMARGAVVGEIPGAEATEAGITAMAFTDPEEVAA